VYQNKKESKKKRGLEQAPTTMQKAPFLSLWARPSIHGDKLLLFRTKPRKSQILSLCGVSV